MDNASKYCLIGKIKGLATQGKRTRVLIRKAKNNETVWSLCHTKRVLGADARHHLLAYGLFKGTPYRFMEGKCREDNKPSAEVILKIIESHEDRWMFAKTWDLEKVKSWLGDMSVTPAVQIAREKEYVPKDFFSKIARMLGL